jgi:hypothetical protein
MLGLCSAEPCVDGSGLTKKNLHVALFRAAPQYRLRNFLLCVVTATASNVQRWYSLCHVRRYDLG